jgi:hypothetical protein
MQVPGGSGLSFVVHNKGGWDLLIVPIEEINPKPRLLKYKLWYRGLLVSLS